MYFYLPDLTEHGFVETNCRIKGQQFYFVFRWNDYCDCAFIRILDSNRECILDDLACVVGLEIHIDERILPVLKLKGENYPPLKETFKDYYIEWQE